MMQKILLRRKSVWGSLIKIELIYAKKSLHLAFVHGDVLVIYLFVKHI